MKPKPLLLIFVLALCTSLAGCGDNAPSSSSVSSQIKLSGHIVNDDGPVSFAKIEAVDAKGLVVAKAELTGVSNIYQLTFPSSTSYPLILTAYPQHLPDQPLKAAVTSSLAAEQDISQISTIVVDTALSLGGINEANLAKAAGAAISLRKKSGGGGGGTATTESFKGDPTKQHGGWH